MELKDYREQIDQVDNELVRLFQKRMDLAEKIGAYKRENGLPVLQSAREREKLTALSAQTQPELQAYVRVLYSLLFELSRTWQSRGETCAVSDRVMAVLESTPRCFPRAASVACQGVEGSYSQLACERLFADPSIQYFHNFEGVFSAIEAGFCQYGVLPVENSTAGTVKRVYDLMISHDFCIVRSTRLKIDHCLLTRESSGDIHEIFSHEQALSQCESFLHTLKDVKITPVENTAVAARLVAESPRRDIAAIASRKCAELYGLKVRQSGIQQEGNNHTRFICIGKKPEIFPGADRTTVRLVLPHRTGALYKVLARLYALGINLLKLESRPIPDRDFEFQFYLDLQTSVYSPEFIQLLCDLDTMCEEFHYLGSYSEVV